MNSHLPFQNERTTMDRLEDLEIGHVALTTSVDRLRRAIYLLARRDELAGREVPAGVLTLLLEPVRAPRALRPTALRAVQTAPSMSAAEPDDAAIEPPAVVSELARLSQLPALHGQRLPLRAPPSSGASSAPPQAASSSEAERTQRKRMLARAVASGLLSVADAGALKGAPGRARGISVDELAALLEARRLSMIADVAADLPPSEPAPAAEVTSRVTSHEPVETCHVTSRDPDVTLPVTSPVTSDAVNVTSDVTGVTSDGSAGPDAPRPVAVLPLPGSVEPSEIVPLVSSSLSSSSSVIVDHKRSLTASIPRARAGAYPARDPAAEPVTSDVTPCAGPEVTSDVTPPAPRLTGHEAPASPPSSPEIGLDAAPADVAQDPGGEIDPDSFEAQESEHLAALAWLRNGPELGELPEASSAPDDAEAEPFDFGAPAGMSDPTLGLDERGSSPPARGRGHVRAERHAPRTRVADPDDDGRDAPDAEPASEPAEAAEAAPSGEGARLSTSELDPRYRGHLWACVDEMALRFAALYPEQACHFAPNSKGKKGQTHGHRVTMRKAADRALHAIAELAPGVLGRQATILVADAFELHLRAHATEGGEWRLFYDETRMHLRAAMKRDRRRELERRAEVKRAASVDPAEAEKKRTPLEKLTGPKPEFGKPPPKAPRS